jgi:hypothetical protein
MKIYISGPITGRPNGNKDAFDRAEETMHSRGHTTFNPQSIPAPTKEVKLQGSRAVWQYYMRECVRYLPTCEMIYMLPGWFESEGATEELRLARLLGLRVVFHSGA